MGARRKGGAAAALALACLVAVLASLAPHDCEAFGNRIRPFSFSRTVPFVTGTGLGGGSWWQSLPATNFGFFGYPEQQEGDDDDDYRMKGGSHGEEGGGGGGDEHPMATVSLKAFLNTVPNHTTVASANASEDASPDSIPAALADGSNLNESSMLEAEAEVATAAEEQAPSTEPYIGSMMNETLFANIKDCAFRFENSASRNSSNETYTSLENLPDNFAYDILQDFAECVSSLIDKGPYSNLTDVVDIMFLSLSQGIDTILGSIESIAEEALLTSNGTGASAEAVEELRLMEEKMLFDQFEHIWTEDLDGNKFLDTVAKAANASGANATDELGTVAGGSAALGYRNDSTGDSSGGAVKAFGGSDEEDEPRQANSSVVAGIVSACVGVTVLSLAGAAYLFVRLRQKGSNEGKSISGFPLSRASLDSISVLLRDGRGGTDAASVDVTVAGAASGSSGAPESIAARDVICEEVIGRGAFGLVYKGRWKGKLVAVKEGYASEDKLLNVFRKEVDVLSRVSHSNVVKLHGACMCPPHVFIVMELLEGSLRDKLNECKRLKYRAILKLANEIASALAYLHPSIVHRDLKPQNILMDANGVAKVADFGIAKFKQSTYLNTTRGNGTPAYMAPETFGSDKISEKADVFSLGMILWECWTGEVPWKECAQVPLQVVMLVGVEKRRPEIPEDCPKQLASLIQRCWDDDPRRRPSCAEVEKKTKLLLEQPSLDDCV